MPPKRTFEVSLLPARHGDAVLLRYGHEDRPHFVLVDGGPRSAYPEVMAHLRGKLGKTPNLRLLVVTHIDNDHIDGAALLSADGQSGITIDDVWFNGWPQVQANFTTREVREVRDRTRGASEGEILERALARYRGRWNRHFEGEAVRTDRTSVMPTIDIEGRLKLTLLSPRGEDLARLRDAWEKAIRKLGVAPGDKAAIAQRLQAHALLRGEQRDSVLGPDAEVAMKVAQRLDKAVANRSSIAFIAEFEGARCLLLGDADMRVIEESIANWCRVEGKEELEVRATKLSHHGSFANLTPSFLRMIRCRHFLVSTDGTGSTKHPDARAIELIVKGVEHPCLHFNYSSPSTARWASPEDQARRGYQARFPVPGETGISVEMLA